MAAVASASEVSKEDRAKAWAAAPARQLEKVVHSWPDLRSTSPVHCPPPMTAPRIDAEEAMAERKEAWRCCGELRQSVLGRQRPGQVIVQCQVYTKWLSTKAYLLGMPSCLLFLLPSLLS